MRPHFNSVFDFLINKSESVCFNFVINGAVISLPMVIKYVKRSKSSFYSLSAKQTPCAPSNLSMEVRYVNLVDKPTFVHMIVTSVFKHLSIYL